LKIGRDGGLEPRADLLLGIGRLGAKVPTGVAEALAHRVDADEGTSIQEVLAGNVTSAHRVDLGPLGVGVVGEKFGSRQLVLGVAVGGLLRVGEGHRAGAEVLKPLRRRVARFHGRHRFHGTGFTVGISTDKALIHRAIVVCARGLTVDGHGCRIAAGHHGIAGAVQIHVVKPLELAREKTTERRVYDVHNADQDGDYKNG